MVWRSFKRSSEETEELISEIVELFELEIVSCEVDEDELHDDITKKTSKGNGLNFIRKY
jgi:hypothetical protein